jgi:hypothetical protein
MFCERYRPRANVVNSERMGRCVNMATVPSQQQQPRYEATAQYVDGDVALIAYSVDRHSVKPVVLGPNGESHQAFVVSTRDGGATWSCLPLVRTIRACFRHSGFPVWPPEHIDTVAIEHGLVRIGFRDEWVMFEPGGESMWTATRSARGLWTTTRVRLMDYDGKDAKDAPQPPPPITVDLPSGFGPPPADFLDGLATRLGGDTRARFAERSAWPVAILSAAPITIWGPGWWFLSVLAGIAIGLPTTSILIERRRHRRTVAGG